MAEKRRSGGEPDAETAAEKRSKAEEPETGPYGSEEAGRRARERDPLEDAEPEGGAPDPGEALRSHVQRKPRPPESPGPDE